MILRLMVKGLKRGKARFACAVAGVAVAVAAVVFMFSLAATNSAQAPALAQRAAAPWTAWQFDGADAGRGPKPDLALPLVSLTIDYRPGGRVLQGPPMRAVLASAPAANPYGSTELVSGRWVDAAAAEPEIVCTENTLKRFGRGVVPPLGTAVKFVGRAGTMTAKIVGYLGDVKLPMGWPGVFANTAAFAKLAGEQQGTIALWKTPPPEGPSAARTPLLTPASETVVASFKGDETRRMDYARPLLLVASVLMALALLVNSLLLSVEANRGMLATLRTVGLTRAGVAGLMLVEAFAATLTGFGIGCLSAMGALVLYVAADPIAFPTGVAFAWTTMRTTFLLALVVAGAAVLFALAPALAVRPLDARSLRPRTRRWGMTVVFACGFAAFVAVEVWGASLMRAFVPSPEWPDAIVSILPAGVSSFEIEKLRRLDGVKRISELVPLQLNYYPEEPMRMPGAKKGAPPDAAKGGRPEARPGRGRGPARRMCRNALFLAAEWLPEFTFIEGTHAEAAQAIASSDAVVITEMMSRAKNLHKGDRLCVAVGGGRGGPAQPVELPIAGVVALNWHMVTSRGLLRGLNGMPGMTDGPVFASFDTVESLDARPAAHVRMTHLWVDYEPQFLAQHGVFPAGRRVEQAIAAALGHPEESTVRLHARDEIADGTLAHGDDVIGQAARVPFVFLLILSIGFIAQLVADADAAKRTFAVLRAVGATRAQLAGRLAARALRTACGGVVIGLPLGAGVGWLFALKTGSVWPGLPHYFVVPVRIVLEGTVVSLAFVLLVAVATASYLVARAIKNGLAR